MKSLTAVAITALLCLALVVSFSSPSAILAQNRFEGQWLIDLETFKAAPDRVHISLRYETERGGRNESSRLVPRDQVQGLSEAQMRGSGSAVQFHIRRDAGTFQCEGWFRAGKGSGHFVFTGDPNYVTTLRRQGYEAPTDEQLFRLGLGDVSLALVEELRGQGYERSTIDQLVRVGTHGVTIQYIRELGALGYRVGKVENLVRMRDHGVTPEYVRELQALGYRELPAEELVRARDHGVTPDRDNLVAAERAQADDQARHPQQGRLGLLPEPIGARRRPDGLEQPGVAEPEVAVHHGGTRTRVPAGQPADAGPVHLDARAPHGRSGARAPPRRPGSPGPGPRRPAGSGSGAARVRPSPAGCPGCSRCA